MQLRYEKYLMFHLYVMLALDFSKHKIFQRSTFDFRVLTLSSLIRFYVLQSHNLWEDHFQGLNTLRWKGATVPLQGRLEANSSIS